jgi:hypothetical protein
MSALTASGKESEVASQAGQNSAGVTMKAMAPAPLVVKKAELADTPSLRALFAVRSRSDESSVIDARGPELDKQGRTVWVAYDGSRAVGMTSVQERRLHVGRETLRMAYWTGLFIDPAYRTAFVYPRLLSAMFSGIRQAGICALYVAVRRQQIANAHVKVGFTKLGDVRVLAKPLRPATLLAKYKRIFQGKGKAWLRSVCRVPDALVSFGFRLQGPHARLPWAVAKLPWTDAVAEDLACLHVVSSVGSTAQIWTSGSLMARYGAPDLDYRVMGVRRQDRLVASAIVRIVDRFEGIRAAVIMDLFYEPELPYAGSMALAAAERLALDEQCDVLLFLDGVSQPGADLLRRRGYVGSPEKYSLLLWTDRGTVQPDFPRECRSWRFTFGDHDTF